MKAELDRSRACLTLHQPLASLMAYGLKRVEGRVWSSDYSGPLWIHAASKEPEPEDIAHFEEFYTEIYRLDTCSNVTPEFPKHYPTSALVGRVQVSTVVSAEDFAAFSDMPPSARAEGRANGSDFFFLCESAERLVMPFQMSGQHKLWMLEKKVASSAAKGLRKCEPMPIKFLHHMQARGPSTKSTVEDAIEEALIDEAICLSLSGEADITPALTSGAGSTPVVSGGGGNSTADLEKRKRSIQKKLRQVNDLLDKQRKGQTLDASQLTKLGTHDELLKELAELDTIT
ncbi:hypothetical protein CYMTET_7265 [Cymbomonas tetramitiformis]|uniref:ASCH domain-containing protein n=1 Tax=Cymbomonas tetramitiformis TaxID=36881 RepID=A0AAE0GVZ5_9CHLO|nr:hypothetical protein CYMTET_7265 [Cymbomonas tetramitiformis]|eukprot:gene7052-8409_t